MIERMPASQGGYFDPYTKVIGLNAARSVNHRVKTLVHEIGHAMMRARNEQAGPAFTYCEEELVVESVAFTVCGSIGLDTSGYSIPYLASWAERAPLETIENAARTIDQIAKQIEGRVIPETGTEGSARDGESVTVAS